MKTNLLETFLRRGLIQHNTEIEATYRGTDMAGYPLVAARGMFLVREVKRHAIRGLMFICASGEDGQRRTIYGDDIYQIDGMSLDRLAESLSIA